jgi:hypothetical protein
MFSSSDRTTDPGLVASAAPNAAVAQHPDAAVCVADDCQRASNRLNHPLRASRMRLVALCLVDTSRPQVEPIARPQQQQQFQSFEDSQPKCSSVIGSVMKNSRRYRTEQPSKQQDAVWYAPNDRLLALWWTRHELLQQRNELR